MSVRYDIVCTIGYQLAKDNYPIERAAELAKEVLWDAGQADYDYMDEAQAKDELDEIVGMLERFWNEKNDGHTKDEK